MIIVKIIGGLGNQMFQYAFARSISLRNNIEFRIDITGFKTYKLREYKLNNLSICENIASLIELQKFNDRAPNKFKLLLNLEKIKIYYKRSRIVEKYPFKFDQNMFHVKDNSYLIGYWQNENYFKKYRDIILKDFTVKAPLSGKNYEVSHMISEANSVSIHIRRGDYANDNSTNMTHGLCDINYYIRSIHLINQNVCSPYFFIFSDDIDWAKENLKGIKQIYFVEHNSEENDYEDMRLMSLCNHNIIANSSFSWWGAWLNTNPSKIVIAPQKWFNDPNRSADGIIPAEWLKI